MTRVRYASKVATSGTTGHIQIMISTGTSLDFQISDFRTLEPGNASSFHGQVRPRSGRQVAEGQRKLGESHAIQNSPQHLVSAGWNRVFWPPLVLPRIVLVDRKGPQCGRSESIGVHRLDQPSSRGPGERLLTWWRLLSFFLFSFFFPWALSGLAPWSFRSSGPVPALDSQWVILSAMRRNADWMTL